MLDMGFPLARRLGILRVTVAFSFQPIGLLQGITRPYLVSLAPEMEIVPGNVESREDEEAFVAALVSRGLTVHPSTVTDAWRASYGVSF